MGRKFWIVIFILLVSAISFARSFLGLIGVIPWEIGYSDIFNADRINTLAAAKIPYIEQKIEYPVVTGFFIFFMWLLGKSLLGYAAFTFIFLILAAAITGLTLYKLAEHLNIDKSRIFIFFVFAPSMLVFGIYNWDIIAVMFMVLALYYFYKNKFAVCGILLSLGFNAKLFPILLLPIMLLKTNVKNGIKIASAFLFTFLVLNIYFMAASFDVWKATYAFHAERAPNIDSIWSLTGLGIQTINILSLALVSIFYLYLLSNHRKCDLLSMSFASILLFLFFNKIFSPQYTLWILPFFVVLTYSGKIEYYSFEASNLIVFFSALNWIFALKQPFMIITNIFVVARALLIAYFIYLCFIRNHEESVWKKSSSSPKD